MPKTRKVIDNKMKQPDSPVTRKTIAKKSAQVTETRKKAKKPSKKADEEYMWPLGKNRYVKVKKFMGSVYVDIRCYYFKNDDIHPSKTGIFLATEQWQEFVKYVEEIDKAVKAKSSTDESSK